MIENPPLDDDLLIHFGVKGMHWGHRKKRPDEEERKKFFQNTDRKRKVAIGVAVVGGALAVSLLLSQQGRVKATDAIVTKYAEQRSLKNQSNQNPVGQLIKKFRDTKAASVPSPDQMIAEARMAGVRNKVQLEGNRRLTERTWRDSASFNREARNLGSTSSQTKIPSLDEIRTRLNDPNYVWQL